MCKYVLLYLMGMALGLRALAQSSPGTIDGVVRDSLSGATLEEATVNLFVMTGEMPGRLFAVRRNGPKGFAFRGLAAGNYWLVGTYLGYRPDTVIVSLGPGNDPDQHILLRMQRSDQEMMQVVVIAHIPPAIVRHDTIAFNTAAFPTPANATLEDLLRKLPGIDIDKDGNVTMQGKKVDKVYVDGKEFFLNDPRVATQNLPADLIDQVEVFDSQTDRARLTGIRETTGNKSINIRLKQNRRSNVVGELYAGTGTGADPQSLAGSYTLGGNFIMLGKMKAFGTGNLNNINNQFTGKENRNGPGTAGIQTLNSFGLNVRDEIGRLTYLVNGGTNGSHTVLDELNMTQTTLTDSSLLSNRSSHSESTSQNWHGNAFIEFRPDSFRVLDWRPGWSGSSVTTDETDSMQVATLKGPANYPDNRGRTVNTDRSTETNVSNQVSFRQQWRRPGRVLYIGLTDTHERQQQPQTTYSLVNNYDSTGHLLSRTLIDEVIRQTATTDGYEAQLAYTEPIRPGHLLDWSYQLDRTVSRSDRYSLDYDSLTGGYDLPDAGTTNHFTSTNTIQRLGMGYNATDGKFQYQVGLTGQLSELDNNNRSTDSTLRFRQTNWYPRASLIYTPGKGRSFNLQYSASMVSPTLQQLQPVTDPTNPFLIRLGNPDLEQQLIHRLRAGFNSFDTHSFRNWQLELDGSYSEHAIVPSITTLAGGIQQQQYVNVNGAWSVSTNLSYGFPLGDQRKANGSIALNGRYNRDISFVNGLQNVTSSPGGGVTGKLNLHPAAMLFVEVQGSAVYTANRYSVNPAQNTVAWTQHYSLQASYTLPWAVTLSTYYDLQLLSGILPAPPVSIWNASVYKEIGRRRHWQLRASAFGLLNNSRNINQMVGIGSVSTTQTNIPGRILLLSLVWHFN